MKILISVSSGERAPMRRRDKTAKQTSNDDAQKLVFEKRLIPRLNLAINKIYFFQEKLKISEYQLERRKRNGEKITAAELKKFNTQLKYYQNGFDAAEAEHKTLLDTAKAYSIKIAKGAVLDAKERKKLADANFAKFKAKVDATDAKTSKLKKKPTAKTISIELTDDRFTPTQRKKLQLKTTKLLVTTTGAVVRKSDAKVFPQLLRSEFAINSIEVSSTGKLKKLVIERLPKATRNREFTDMSAAALLKLLTGEKASLKAKKGTKSAVLK